MENRETCVYSASQTCVCQGVFSDLGGEFSLPSGKCGLRGEDAGPTYSRVLTRVCTSLHGPGCWSSCCAPGPAGLWRETEMSGSGRGLLMKDALLTAAAAAVGPWAREPLGTWECGKKLFRGLKAPGSSPLDGNTRLELEEGAGGD